MKKLIPFFCAIVLVACQDNREQNATRKSVFNTNTGQLIAYADAARWIANYQSSSASSRSQTATASLTIDQLKTLTNDTNLAGLVFHHALDDNGAYHLLVVPADETSILWSSSAIADATAGTTLSSENAARWAASYVAANPGKIQYHFFGSHVFDEIESVPGLSAIDIEPAVNDAGAPQLLLIASLPGGTSSGRIESSTLIYDFSRPCPPYCGTVE